MKVHADVKDLMGKLLEVSYDGTTQKQKEWLAFCRKTNEKYPTVLPEYYESKQLNPYVFLRKLSEAWKEGDVVVTGNGSACVITFQTADIKKNQRLIYQFRLRKYGIWSAGSFGMLHRKRKRSRDLY